MVNIAQQYDKIPEHIVDTFEFISAGNTQRTACMPESVLHQLLQMANTNMGHAVQVQQDIQDIADAKSAWAAYSDNPEQQIPTDIFRKVLYGENPIRVYRQWRGFTVKQLASKTGLNENVIYSMENGTRTGKIDAYCKIADVLNLIVDDIVPVALREN